MEVNPIIIASYIDVAFHVELVIAAYLKIFQSNLKIMDPKPFKWVINLQLRTIALAKLAQAKISPLTT